MGVFRQSTGGVSHYSTPHHRPDRGVHLAFLTKNSTHIRFWLQPYLKESFRQHCESEGISISTGIRKILIFITFNPEIMSEISGFLDVGTSRISVRVPDIIRRQFYYAVERYNQLHEINVSAEEAIRHNIRRALR